MTKYLQIQSISSLFDKRLIVFSRQLWDRDDKYSVTQICEKWGNSRSLCLPSVCMWVLCPCARRGVQLNKYQGFFSMKCLRYGKISSTGTIYGIDNVLLGINSILKTDSQIQSKLPNTMNIGAVHPWYWYLCGYTT